jgi:RHH-type proline utilization regulon transcriptional repressor/proline dehydrogenase/delta 1-pyrroline-5-carboxylate dehydrogenase
MTQFDLEPQTLDALRAGIAARHRCPEAPWILALAEEAALAPTDLARAQASARQLAIKVRAARARTGGVDALMQEFSLSSVEGVALMCVAEALLRIPDAATRDRLIRDKIGRGDWRQHIGSSHLFVNAAAWGLLITGKLVATHSDRSLDAGLAAVVRRGGEPLIRKGVDLAMRLLGRQFVMAETIEDALEHARARESRGYRFSFDMLGEAATTAADAERYYQAYSAATHAIGRASAGRGIYAGPGISVKLSALHPRYTRAQRHRVMTELLPRLTSLLLVAKSYDVGLAIDAEETERLDLSLDILDALVHDPLFAGWNGISFVVQAYQKRAPLVIDWIVDLAKRSSHRIMVRLVKGAYWDSEIKRAQQDGLPDYPVFTRKVHTDVAYLACARRMLAAPAEIYPQFATHNAFTIGAIHAIGADTDFEFQCLHGMGESIYDEIVGPDKLDIPCRIYAPVGSHETLLPYLVRRLLENGANTSFVHRLVDPQVHIDELIEDPVAETRASGGLPHARIPSPPELYPDRRNSRGFDFGDELAIAALADDLAAGPQRFAAHPLIADSSDAPAIAHAARNPANHDDVVGEVVETTPAQADRAIGVATGAIAKWQATPVDARARAVERWADLLEEDRTTLYAIAVREAGKSLANAVAEVREAADLCRYYAQHARDELDGARALGPVVCISPWNFPLAIFTGQIAAALVAGNPVLAKPAESTPLIAAHAIELAYRAGIPRDALQLLPGRGSVIGARLTADPRVQGVVFTGSTEVARSIQRAFAKRADDPVLIAETGGLNAMIVDSSALPEQVVADVLSSAFDSAGQRCSALRILCLQEEIADRVLTMLKGAMRELRLGNPVRLATDVGPVIDADAQAMLERHVKALGDAGLKPYRVAPPAEVAKGTYVSPTLVELPSVDRLRHEVFGPILHVVRYRSDALPDLLAALNASGYGLTHGIHTRIDETVDEITANIHAGNIYVNRNIIGAVVGVQPFGGEGLSGTGPKAGGPFYIHRLARGSAPPIMAQYFPDARAVSDVVDRLHEWIRSTSIVASAEREDLLAALADVSRFASKPAAVTLPGPTGESDRIELKPRGRIACIAANEVAAIAQISAVMATGNTPVLAEGARAVVPPSLVNRCEIVADPIDAPIDAVLADLPPAELVALGERVAARDGAIVPVIVPTSPLRYPAWRLFNERAISINTAAAGGNAALMTLDDPA